MTGRRLDEAGWAAVGRAVRDAGVAARFRAAVVRVPGSGCVWWSGAVSGRGHGRFWIGPSGPGRVVIAHRFAFALEHGVAALREAPLLGHGCDNTLCQRIGPGHVRVTTVQQNRVEWAARRHLAGTPLDDPRGPAGRARALRDMLRIDPALVAADLAALRALRGVQLPLW